MASFNRVTFSGSTDTISVPFGYLDKSHVVVSLDGVVLASGAYSWPSNGQVKITAGNPAAGVVGEVRRVTPATPLVNFEPGNLDTDDLDTASLQAIYIAEEAKDGTSDVDDRVWYTSEFQLGGTITKGSEDTVPKFDADGNLVPGPTVSEVSSAQSYALQALGYRNEAEGFAQAAATFDPANFYTKTEADAAFISPVELAAASYTKTETNNLLAAKVDLSEVKWLSKAIGEFYFADDGVTGVDIPPSGTGGSTVWIELTAGLTGVGQFNNGKLSGESVSGSAPLVLATAVIALAGSAMNGQTVRLLNTERRMLRAGSAGTLQNDALQNVTGTLLGSQESFSGTGVFSTGTAGASDRPNNGTAGTARANFSLAGDSNARTDTETRMKNIGVRVFRRIK